MDAGYFAGFFDADGAVGISKGTGTSYYLLNCQITQVDPAPLLLFKERYGGKVNGPYEREGNARPIYRWSVQAAKAEKFLLDVVDQLVVKRERTRAALDFRELFKGDMILPRGKNKNDAKRDNVISLREAAYERMLKANKRGVA